LSVDITIPESMHIFSSGRHRFLAISIMAFLAVSVSQPRLFPREQQLSCAALEAARSVMQKMKPFRAEFVQQVYYDEELAVEERGDLLFVEPRMIRWTYREPELKVFLLDGDGYRFYEPAARQMTVGSLKGRRGGWIWQLLVSSDPNVVEACPPSGKEMILRDPVDGTSFRVRLDDERRIVRVEHQDAGGARHVYLLSDYQPRVEVGSDAFTLDPPPGTEVVNMDAESP